TGISWDDSGTVLTVTVREGVTWTDGEAFDAEDVAFTYLMLRDVPATNMDALDVIDAAVVEPLTAEISFGSTHFAHEPTIGGLPIVPEHVFSTFEDPSAEPIEQPVGTGPYRLDRSSTQPSTFVRTHEHRMAEAVAPPHRA